MEMYWYARLKEVNDDKEFFKIFISSTYDCRTKKQVADENASSKTYIWLFILMTGNFNRN